MNRRANGENLIRPEAVAGMFYPSQPAVLQEMVHSFIEQARLPELPSPPRALIVPHAGYIYSGPIAGYGYRALRELPPGSYTVLLLGPAHRAAVWGVAVGAFTAFRTPLGQVPVSQELVEQLLRQGKPFIRDLQAHLPEHSLEVQLPFLQSVMGDSVRLVPLLFGEVDPELVAAALTPLVQEDPSLLLVISSDLSHYYPYEVARKMDTALLSAVERGAAEEVAKGEACGMLPILTLMAIARQLGWRAHILDYRNSGDTAGDRARVVGYGAVAYTV
jgi:AmmeMemoRadiSam system protein B